MAKPTVQSVKTQIDTHEAICAERWQKQLIASNAWKWLL